MNDMNDIGGRIKLYRKRAGLTLTDLADSSGLSASFISKLESGKLGISVGNLDKISSALGLAPLFLMTEEQNERKLEKLTRNLAKATPLPRAGLPEDMQGLSLKPLFTGSVPVAWRDSVYYNYYEFPAVHSVRRHEGVFDGRYKLIYFYDLDEWEFYDTEKDPREMKSEYGNPEYSEIIKTLQAELERLKAEYQVPPPEPLENNPDA